MAGFFKKVSHHNIAASRRTIKTLRVNQLRILMNWDERRSFFVAT